MVDAEIYTIKSKLNKLLSPKKWVWDDFYRTADYIAEASPYFDFYELETAHCDRCSETVDQTNSILVSGLTIRQNKRFVEDYMKEIPWFIWYENLVKDWSVWLLCKNCAAQWNFASRSI